jgi:cytochrome c oxidase cbb3-type subunit 3
LVALVVLAACYPGGPPDDATGEEIYAEQCARCHGEELGGRVVGPSLRAGSEAAKESDEFLEFTIMNGRGRMPSFSSTLDAAQIDRVIAYIREVQNDA